MKKIIPIIICTFLLLFVQKASAIQNSTMKKHTFEKSISTSKIVWHKTTLHNKFITLTKKLVSKENSPNQYKILFVGLISLAVLLLHPFILFFLPFVSILGVVAGLVGVTFGILHWLESTKEPKKLE